MRQNKRKHSKLSYNDFIIDEAEVDDEEEAEDSYHDSDEEVIDYDEEDKTNFSRPNLFSTRFEDIYSDSKRREIEDYYERLYSKQTRTEETDEISGEISRQKLLPSVKDPNLWLVKCRIGEERTTALQLMRKFIAMQDTDNSLMIKSVITRDSLKGYIYIEAYKQAHTKQAIDGVGSLRTAKTAQMVPVREMTDVLKTIRDTELKPGTWVRVRSGLYKDDLAKVAEVRHAENQVSLYLVPRIDMGRISENKRRYNSTETKKRPQQARFSVDVIRELGGTVGRSEDYYIYQNSRFTKSGFLLKVFQINAIISGGVTPLPEELSRFDQSENTVTSESNIFVEGDLVVAIKGDLYGLEGKVRSVDDQTVTMETSHNTLNGRTIQVHCSELSKLIKVGDSVRVVRGEYEGDTGIVLFVDGRKVYILSDSTQQEFETTLNYVRLGTDGSGTVNILGMFKIGQLVQIEPQVVGVIIRLERHNLVILNQFGKTIKKNHSSLSNKKVGHNSVTLDCDNQPVSINSSVKVVKGPLENESGTVLYIYKNFVFIKSANLMHNAGTFVVVGRNLMRLGVDNDSRRQIAEGKFGMSSPLPMASPMQYAKTPKRQSMNAQRGVRDRRIIGNAVMITKGPLKGNIGIIKDATDTTAQVELHCHSRTVNFDRANLSAVRPGKDNSYEFSTNEAKSLAVNPRPVEQKPGSATPKGSRTPAYPQTPMIEGDGGLTPHINPFSEDLHSVPDYGRINWQSPLDTPSNLYDSPMYSVGSSKINQDD